MARAIWSGSISFGLVNVPVKAFTAVHDHKVHFHRLEKKTGARVRNQQVSETSGKSVDRDAIELGYEIGKGRYVTFDQDEVDDLKPASTRSIDVADFVPLEDIDPVFYQSTYWLAPDGDAAVKPYGLLLAAMIDQQRVGIGSVVMRTTQYLAAIRPLEGALAMSTMRFADEVVSRSDIDQLPKRIAQPAPKELKLARQIVDALATEWKPEQYHDTYTEELRDLIERKDKGEEVVIEASGDAGDDAEIVDLMAALQASVESSRSGRKATSRSTAGTKTRSASPASPSKAKTKAKTKTKASSGSRSKARSPSSSRSGTRKSAATKKASRSKAGSSSRSQARSA